MDKHDVALIGVLVSLFLGMISFFDSGSLFFNEFIINVIFSVLVMIAVFAYANKRYFFNYMILIYSSLSIMNLVYLYIYHPVWMMVPNFVVCAVLFIKYSFFIDSKRRSGRDAVLADTVRDTDGSSDVEPRISVDIISENPENVNPREKKALRRFLEKIKKGFRVLKFRKSRDYPRRSEDRSFIPDSYVPDHSNPRDFDVSMDRTPKNGYFELKVDEKGNHETEDRPRKKPAKSEDEKLDEIFEKASVEPLPEITYDSKKKRSVPKAKPKKKSKN